MLHEMDEPTDAAASDVDRQPHPTPLPTSTRPPLSVEHPGLSSSAAAALAILSSHHFDTSALPPYTPSAAHEARIASENLAAAAAAAAAAAEKAEAAEAAAAAAAASTSGPNADATPPNLHALYPVPHYVPTLGRHPLHSDTEWEPLPPSWQPRRGGATAALNASPASTPGRPFEEDGTAGANGSGQATQEEEDVDHRSRSLEIPAGAPRHHRRRRGRSVGVPARGVPSKDDPVDKRESETTQSGGSSEVHWLDRALKPMLENSGDGSRPRDLDIRRRGGMNAADAASGARDNGRRGREPRRRDDAVGGRDRRMRRHSERPPHRRRHGAPPRSEPGRVPASVVIRRRGDPSPTFRSRNETTSGRQSRSTAGSADGDASPPPCYYGPCPDGGSAAPVAPPVPSFGPDRLPSPLFEQPPNAPQMVHLSAKARPAAAAAVAASPARYAASSRWHATARKALLIGAGYGDDPRAALAGPTTDVRIMRYLLISKFRFSPADVTVITDDPNTHDLRESRLRGVPTRAAILAAMRELVAEAEAGASLLVFFAGHGTRVVDTSGDEEDGFDEAIVPVDYATAGVIIDDELYDVLVRPLPQGVRLFILFDACHSATAVDLPYVFSPVPLTGGADAVGRGIRSVRLSTEGTSSSPSSGETDDRGNRGRRDYPDDRDRRRNRHRNRHRHRPCTSAADAGYSASTGQRLSSTKAAKRASHGAPSARSVGLAISLSACADAGTASDARTDGGIATGAMTYAFVDTIEGAGPGRSWGSLSYAELLVRMRDTLHKAGHMQQAQISTNIPHFDLSRRLDGQW